MTDDTEEPRPRPGGRPERARGGVSTNFPCDLDSQVHDVAVDEKKSREPVEIHEPQLRVQTVLGVFLCRAAGLVERGDLGQADRGERFECFTSCRSLEIRELVAEIFRQIEGGAPLSDEQRVRERFRSALEAVAHLPRLGEVEEPVGPPCPVRAVERRSVLDGDEHVLEPMPLGAMIVHVSGRHDTESQTPGEPSERLVTCRISLHGIVLQLHEDAARPERVHELLSHLLGFGDR